MVRQAGLSIQVETPSSLLRCLDPRKTKEQEFFQALFSRAEEENKQNEADSQSVFLQLVHNEKAL